MHHVWHATCTAGLQRQDRQHAPCHVSASYLQGTRHDFDLLWQINHTQHSAQSSSCRTNKEVLLVARAAACIMQERMESGNAYAAPSDEQPQTAHQQQMRQLTEDEIAQGCKLDPFLGRRVSRLWPEVRSAVNALCPSLVCLVEDKFKSSSTSIDTSNFTRDKFLGQRISTHP